MGKIKVTQADVHFSKCVRTAANWTCQRCHKQYPEDWGGLECAHFMTRGSWSTRFDPDNVAALCTGCHFYLDSHPYEKVSWFEGYLGEGLAEIIRLKSNTPAYGIKKHKKEISKHYREELKRLKQARIDGGELKVIGYE